MKKTRIDFDDNGDQFARLVHTIADYQRAVRDGDTASAAGHAYNAEKSAGQLCDEALLHADEEMSRPQIARGMGLTGQHADKTVTYRINRARSATSEQPPAHLYLVKRQADREPEFLSLHRTREGAQDRADAYNTRFGHSAADSSRAMVIRVSGRFPQEDTNAPAIEE